MIPIEGKRFYHLIVVSYSHSKINPSGQTQRMYKCRCDCGNEIITRGADLRFGKSKSCGCFGRENTSAAKKTHGGSKTRLYQVWAGMKARCLNPNHSAYKRYGGRGIKIHQPWIDNFEQFKKDLPPEVEGKPEIDRIDNSKGYEPGNIQWADALMQAANTRQTVFVEIDGERLHLCGWARRLGVTDGMLRHRRKRLGSNEAAIRSVINGS